jgi:hypothetical protein
MEGRGLTLRSKNRRARPQISAPKPISAPLPQNQNHQATSSSGNASSGSGPRDLAGQKDATSDLVKRRYSTRFNQAPEFDGAPPVPTVPQVPSAFAGLSPPQASRKPSTESSGPPEVDLNALRDPSLPVDRCLLYATLMTFNC